MDIFENEYIINKFLEKHDNAKILPARINNLNYTKPFLKYKDETLDPQIENTLRIMPQDNDTEGFFIAKIQKI